LRELLEENSDEIFSAEISGEIIGKRGTGSLSSTTDLAEAVRDGCRLAHKTRNLNPPDKGVMNSAIARTLQAIRIQVLIY